MPVTAPDLKATERPPARLWRAASVVRTFARTWSWSFGFDAGLSNFKPIDGFDPGDTTLIVEDKRAVSGSFGIRKRTGRRLSLGGWKLLFGGTDWVQPAETEQLERGRYLVEALAHCGECHTPRNALGALDTSQWMAGAPNPSGEGRIPGLRAGQLSWSETDIAYYLETGFTPDFDSAGGQMAKVIAGLQRLSPEDRDAIAAYLKALD